MGALGEAVGHQSPGALTNGLPLRGPTTGGRLGRWRDELRRALRCIPHVMMAVSLLVLVLVNAWWLHEQSGTVDAGRLPFEAASPALPHPGSTTTSWPRSPTTSTATTAPARPEAAVDIERAGTATDRVGTATPASEAVEHAAPPPSVAPVTAPAPAAVPVSLRIDDLGVEANVLQVGIAPDGSLEVPEQVSDVGWFREGARPGQPGAAVVVGHVDSASQGPGAFFLLRDVAIGTRISVLDDQATRQDFEVVARREYRKVALPIDSLFRRDGPAVLTLVTCGGKFDVETRSYDSNIVLHAVPVSGGAEQLP